MNKSLRKALLALAVLVALGVLLYHYHSTGFIHLADFSTEKLWQAVLAANPFLLGLSLLAIYGCYALRSLRWQVLQSNLGPARFSAIYQMTLAGFAALFLLGRPGELVRPILLARKERLPVPGMFGVYVLERLFDAASTAIIAAVGLMLFNSRAYSSNQVTVLETAARTTGFVLFGGVFASIGFLVYLRMHGTAALSRRLEPWLDQPGARAHFARVVLGFAQGIQTIRGWADLLLASFYSAAHWILVLFVYLWVSHAFGGSLARIQLGDAMLLMAFTLVGSAVQLPAVGGGSQVASLLAYTTIFGVGKEPASAAAIMIWLITFAAVAIVGTPILIHQGLSLGQLKEMAEHEKEALES